MRKRQPRRQPHHNMRECVPVMCQEPNEYARPAQLELHENSAIFHGYQEFVLTKDTIDALPSDPNLKKKHDLLAPFFRPNYLSRRAMLDLGANAGFFCFWALQNQAEKALALDMDETYLSMVRKAAQRLGFDGLRTVRANFSDWNRRSDIVLALALLHWVYSCTAVFGTIDSIMKRLAELARYMLVVEWIDPEDEAIQFFRHTGWNEQFIREPYTRAAFEASLSRRFARHRLLGEITQTRWLYVAFKTTHEIDLSGPLPLLLPKERVITSRCLAKHEGTQYWSRVYDDGRMIHKQATLDLAEREAYFLSRLNCRYFPRVLRVESRQDWSVVTFEKISGRPLREALSEIRRNPETFYSFVQGCLDILEELRKKGITHRDIRIDNMHVRKGKPILMDFGWAISGNRPYSTPAGLGDSGRPSDGSFCDAYSMGKVLEEVNQHRYQEFDSALELMTEPEAHFRITNLKILKVLFASAAACSRRKMG